MRVTAYLAHLVPVQIYAYEKLAPCPRSRWCASDSGRRECQCDYLVLVVHQVHLLVRQHIVDDDHATRVVGYDWSRRVEGGQGGSSDHIKEVEVVLGGRELLKRIFEIHFFFEF